MAERGLFDGVSARGGADTGDRAWLTAMLQIEAALARALERAGLAPAGAGAAVTEAAGAGTIDAAELGRRAALTGSPVPALVRALAASARPCSATPACGAGWTPRASPPAQVESALDPVGYLGAAGEFTDAALAAHRAAGG